MICGLFDGIKKQNRDSRLYGFLMGPGGLVDHDYVELTADIIDEYRNTGGFDIIGSGRTKLEKKEQFDKGLEILKELDITALVIIGGDDSNTNAAVLAEYYKSIGAGVQVIGCPKTIDGDLKNEVIETSFGFDTATKVYSELIGNIQRDCFSAKKYRHFIKLMGRSASHIALECALQTQPNICIISEEVEAENMTLDDVINYIADIVAERASRGLNFGTVLIPEGLIEFIPAMKSLIAELNDLLAHTPDFAAMSAEEQRRFVVESLSEANSRVYSSLPAGVAVSSPSTATPTAMYRCRSSRLRSCSARWLQPALKRSAPKAATRASSRPSTTSSATKAAALPLQLRRRLLLRTGLQRRLPHRCRRDRLHVEPPQSDPSVGSVALPVAYPSP